MPKGPPALRAGRLETAQVMGALFEASFLCFFPDEVRAPPAERHAGVARAGEQVARESPCPGLARPAPFLRHEGIGPHDGRRSTQL